MFQLSQSTGALTEVPGSPFAAAVPTQASALASPICLTTEKSGQFLYVGYASGSFSGFGAVGEFSIDAANQQLVPLPAQSSMDISSAPIGILADPKGVHLYVGLGVNPTTGAQSAGTNVYSIDPITGALAFTGTAGGAITAGRSIAIDPQGRFFFDGWGTTLATIDSALISPADGTALTGITSVSSPNQSPGAMLTDSSGKFLYVEQGFAQVVFAINQTTGALTQPPTPIPVFSFTPASAAADPLGPYIYSLQQDGVHAFLVDAQSGALSEVPGSPFGGVATQGGLAISGAPVQAASGPAVALFPASQDFGGITVGQSSSSKIFTLTNTGDQSLSLNSWIVTGTNSSDFLITPNCSIPTVLGPNATCTASVIFSPTAAGPRQASLTGKDNAPGSPQSIPLTGTGVSPVSALSLAPGSLTFASATQGSTSAPQPITLTSLGPANLRIVSVLTGGANPADFQVNSTCAGAYPIGSTCNIAVAFSPLGAGQRTATLTITDDAPDSPQSVQLSGTGATPPPGTSVVKLAPSAVSFGAVTQATMVPPQATTLTSSGTGPLHISSVALGGTNAADFTLSSNCTAPAYAVGATCAISVSLAPNTVGARAAVVVITDDAPNSPQTIALTAVVSPALQISPTAAGSTSATITAGQTAAFSLQLTPGLGFAGNASFTCAGAPSAAVCSAPAQQIVASTPITYLVTVTTTANTMDLPSRPQPPILFWLRLVSLIAWGGILVLFRYAGKAYRPRSAPQWACVAVVVFATTTCLIGIAGCGGAGAGGTVTPQTVPTPHTQGTPPGTSIITLTPSVTNSAGTPVAGIPPVQLTFTVQ
jgi:6-phosphogluconolactonase (cycloisomerase 2 family)